MYCAPFCSLPISSTLRLLSCEAVLEPQQRCRSRNSFWQCPERLWCLRNGKMLQILADRVGKPVEQVCPFMYGLTMKKLGEIMNPKCAGWNYFRVPLSRPDTCLLYSAIFTINGDIKKPMNPLIIKVLVVLIRHFLKLPCLGDGPKRRPNIDDMFTGGQEDCLDPFKRRSRRGRRGKMGATGPDGDGDGNGLDGLADAMNELQQEDALGDDDEDSDSDDGMGDMGDGDDEEQPPPPGLYNLIKKKKKVVEIEEVETPEAKDKKKKKKKVKKFKENDRRYMGKIIPVLMHEPFDQSKPWTWVRRHPLQDRVIEGTEIGRAKVHRYKRMTLEKQMARAQQRYSTHSVYSVGEHKSVLETAMFGHGQHKKKHPGMAKSYDYKKLREVVPVEVEQKGKKGKKNRPIETPK